MICAPEAHMQAELFGAFAFASVLALTAGLHAMRTRNAIVLNASAVTLLVVAVAGTVVNLVSGIVWVPLGIAGVIMLVKRKSYLAPPPVSGVAPPPKTPSEDDDGPTA